MEKARHRRNISEKSDSDHMTSDEDVDSSPEIKSIKKSGYYERIIPTSRESYTHPRQDNPRKSYCTWQNIKVPLIVLSFIVLLVIAVLPYISGLKKCNPMTPETIKSNFKNQITDLSFIIRSIIDEKRNNVDSIVLLHSPENYYTAKCLATEMANLYAYQRMKDCNVNTIDPKIVNIDSDFGDIFESLKNGLSATTVIQNLSSINYKSAQIFHTMCDDITALRKPSLYLFTLLSDQDFSGSPLRDARNILHSSWNELPDNILDPLLSRILGHVIPVNSEPKIPCPLS